jgi:broad specificity phosphatase PhoE
VSGQLAELTVVRHGQSVANVALAAAQAAGLLESGVTGRDADIELSPLGWTQAEALGRWLARLPAVRRPQVVVCSPYRRARQTWQRAAATAADLGVPLPAATLDARLCDRLMGELELMTGALIAQRFPAEAARRSAAGEFAYCPPGGESFGDIAVRLETLLRDLDHRHAGRRVFLVAHDAVVLMLRHAVERLTFAQVAAIVRAGPVANASITRFTAGAGGLRLAEYNSTGHLAGTAS